MATVEQIRKAMQSQPFRPFTVYLVDGRTYTVKHPDFIAVPSSPRGREFVIYDDQGSHYLDLGLIVEVHQPDADAARVAER
jgi:hypothetical protein